MRATSYFQAGNTDVAPDKEAGFYSELKMKNGTFKTTKSGRFPEIDRFVEGFLSKQEQSGIEILDVGVSAGISTVELHSCLEKAGLTPKIVASDLYLDAFLVPLGANCSVLTDRDGWPLQYELGPLVVKPWIRRLDYLTLIAPIKLLAARLLGPKLRRKIQTRHAKPVKLATKTILATESILLVEDNIMIRRVDFEHRFRFIRVANILNTGYFPESELRLALRNIMSYLAGPGSILLVVRTGERDGPNDGTLFTLTEHGKLLPVQTFGKGTEILQLILEQGDTDHHFSPGFNGRSTSGEPTRW